MASESHLRTITEPTFFSFAPQEKKELKILNIKSIAMGALCLLITGITCYLLEKYPQTSVKRVAIIWTGFAVSLIPLIPMSMFLSAVAKKIEMAKERIKREINNPDNMKYEELDRSDGFLVTPSQPLIKITAPTLLRITDAEKEEINREKKLGTFLTPLGLIAIIGYIVFMAYNPSLENKYIIPRIIIFFGGMLSFIAGVSMFARAEELECRALERLKRRLDLDRDLTYKPQYDRTGLIGFSIAPYVHPPYQPHYRFAQARS